MHQGAHRPLVDAQVENRQVAHIAAAALDPVAVIRIAFEVGVP